MTAVASVAAGTTRTRRGSHWAAWTAGGVGLALGLRPLADNSFLTHLATGRLILDRLALPTADPYSFSALGSNWTVQSWLPSVLYGLAERAGGGLGLLLLRATVTVALALLVWRLTAPALGLGGRLGVFVAAVSASASLWAPRPLLMGLVLFALAVVVIEDESGRWPAWSLIPIGWVWVNSHGTFPLLLAYVALRVVGRRLDGASASRLVGLLGRAGAGVLVGAVGPLGLSGLLFPLQLLGRSSALRHVVEWQSPSFTTLPSLVFLGLLVVALRGRRRWEDALPALAFFVLALTAVRHVPWAVVVLVPVAARAVAGRAASGAVARVAAGALVVVCCVVVLGRIGGDAYDLAEYPVAEVQWMADHGLEPRDVRVAAPALAGNYLTWRDGAEANVFFDDRFDMYPLAVVDAYNVLALGQAEWRDVMERYGIEAVLWQRSKPLAGLVSESSGWRVIYTSADWLVAVPTSV